MMVAPKPAMPLRRALPADADSLTACIVAAYAPFRARGLQLPPVEAGIAADIADHYVWVAGPPGQVIAGLVAIAGAAQFKIANLAVSPQAQGQGLARQLLQQAADTARDLDYGGMWLTTHAEMHETIALYTHLGWRRQSQDGNRLRMFVSL